MTICKLLRAYSSHYGFVLSNLDGFGATGGLNVYKWTRDMRYWDTCVDNAKTLRDLFYQRLIPLEDRSRESIRTEIESSRYVAPPYLIKRRVNWCTRLHFWHP